MRRVRSSCCERASSGQISAAALNNVMNSRRLIADPRGPQGIVAAQTCTGKDPAHVRFGSKADMCGAPTHVRFTPKADVCSAKANVHFGPIADIEVVA